ncbi:MAG: pyridoxamine 5'-phosphate oxidase family protein [Devosia sp.]
MAHEEHHKSAAEYQDRAWELVKKIQFALFTTWDGHKQAQWPLTAHEGREDGEIYFLVGGAGEKYIHLTEFPAVTLGFADPGGPKYVVINGHAAISNNRGKIKELFSPFAKAWWNSADDPDIRLLTVTPDKAEIWDSPNKLIATAVMLTAAATGTKPAVGDHGTARM